MSTRLFLLLSFIFDFLFLTFKFMIDKVESVLKKLQLFSINKHKTSELITDSQLWFHPEDFEKKIKARLPPRNWITGGITFRTLPTSIDGMSYDRYTMLVIYFRLLKVYSWYTSINWNRNQYMPV